ncbi:protein kinase domain-containing protein [Streptosporangium sp. KLBMP 9127]|nr:serine/threonine-protein kinase [Streptosporangium sp. KLBMP 9127]
MAVIESLRAGDPRRIGEWRLLGRLGGGGQGVVYLGETAEGGKVAVKLVHAHLIADTKAKKYLVAEVEAMRKVAAFCTARVLAADVEGDQPYIVSEYVDGPSLHQVVSAAGPRDASALIRLAIGTATALTAIHQAEVIHRDFKPSNVLLGSDGPRVIDFGIAKILDLTTTISAELIGTPSYMAPEQLSGERLTSRLDVFAWGCTMVYAATGQSPFGHDALPLIMNRILHAPPELGTLDGPLRPMIEACLEKLPANRPSAREVLLELLDSSSPEAQVLPTGADLAARGPVGEQTIVPPPLAVTETPRLSRRRVLAALTGAAALLAGTAVALRGTLAAEPTTLARPTPGALPGLRGSLQPDASASVIMTSYTAIVSGKLANAYVLNSETGQFDATAYRGAGVSFDRRYVAGVSEPIKDLGAARQLTIEDRSTGQKHPVKLNQPFMAPRWSPTRNQLVVTLLDGAETAKGVGYAIVSPDDYTPKIVKMDRIHLGALGWPLHPGTFAWSHDGTTLVAASLEGSWADSTLWVYAPDGKLIKSYPGLGQNVGYPFSPDGKLIATQTRFAGSEGDKGKDQVTVFDAGTRAFVRDLPTELWFMGWYDASHIIGYHWERDRQGVGQVRIVGTDGTLGRVLVTNDESPANWNIWPTYSRVGPQETRLEGT